MAEGASAATSGRARCRQCTGPGNTELKCTQCDRVKSIEEFAKNQRHERDSAVCLHNLIAVDFSWANFRAALHELCPETYGN